MIYYKILLIIFYNKLMLSQIYDKYLDQLHNNEKSNFSIGNLTVSHTFGGNHTPDNNFQIRTYPYEHILNFWKSSTSQLNHNFYVNENYLNFKKPELETFMFDIFRENPTNA